MSELSGTGYEALPTPDYGPGFQTEWFVIQTAGNHTPDASAALERLCRTYWYPLYAHVRRHGFAPCDAEDLTQGFFAHLLERPWLRNVHPAHGRFRSFLLASFNHFLANEWRREQTQKRGRGRIAFFFDAAGAEDCYRLEPAHSETPDKIYDLRWARAVLHRVETQLAAECHAAGKTALFEQLKGVLEGQPHPPRHGEIAAHLGLTESAVKKAAQRLRERYAELLRAEVAQTVHSPAEVDEELRQLLAILRG